MNIVFFCMSIPGGVGNYTYYLARELAKRNFGVDIFCHECRLPRPPGVQIHRIPFIPIRQPWLTKLFYYNIINFVAYAREAKRFDVVHGNSAQAWFLKNMCGFEIPFVLTAHGSYKRDWLTCRHLSDLPFFSKIIIGPEFEFISGWQKFEAKNADQIIAVSYDVAKDYSLFYKVDSSKITVIPVGVDTNMFNPNVDCSFLKQKFRSKNIVLSVGALIPRKAYELLIKAIPIVVKENRDVLFLIIGSGPERSRIVRLVKELKIERYVKLIPYVDENELCKYYAACHVFAHPSVYEGIPTVILEAMATGRPSVGFNTYGVRNVIETNKTGFLARAFDFNHFADAIIALLADESLRERIGATCRAVAEKQFAWPVIADRTIEVYKEIVG
jgi:glycosyltransferase involved in cell wall biosynthesis